MKAPAPNSNNNAAATNKTKNVNAIQAAVTTRQLILQKATLNGNQLTGTNRVGQTVTVNLDSTTKIVQLVPGIASDLQVGQIVVITPKPNSTDARSIVIGNITQPEA